MKITGAGNPNSKAVINLETGKIFLTIKEASEWAGLKSVSSIGENCKGNNKSAGTHPETGIRLYWRGGELSNEVKQRRNQNS